ncbi:hypothetical protein Pyn_19701 [Prunus yedoensis var. nudiflora]|uniref:Uncharacterized protein n=1 Tax=Prunus yedoensis var. nudiflora TaxID=2094558 RepID=A0A314ZB39_PRUYE|nr:hypothetical protein Pyn_19701 [Prunus yedoensis var. nudiflora]
MTDSNATNVARMDTIRKHVGPLAQMQLPNSLKLAERTPKISQLGKGNKSGKRRP